MKLAIPDGTAPGRTRIWRSFTLPGDHVATGTVVVR